MPRSVDLLVTDLLYALTGMCTTSLHTCRASMDGGGIFVSGKGATLTNLNTSYIIRNRAQGPGGGCSFIGGVSVLANNDFGHNWSGTNGGAIAYNNDCFVAGNSFLDRCNHSHPSRLACLRCCHCKITGLARHAHDTAFGMACTSHVTEHLPSTQS